MNETPVHPISRRIMLALFAVAVAPMLGWSLGLERGDPVQKELWVVLALTVATMGGAVIYVRREVVDPLASLARLARTAQDGRWETPNSVGRTDEIGELAQALDRAIRTLEDRAEEATRTAADLSHELRTPLAAIRGAAELLADGSLDDVARARFVTNVAIESARLERLVAGLLDLERLRQGRSLPLRARMTRPSEIAEAVSALCRPLAERRGLRVRGSISCPDAPVLTDPDRCHRIMVAMFENAVQHAPRGTELTISVKGPPELLILSVSQRGPGAAIENPGPIFDRAVGTEGSSGTGLGLAIVRALAEGLGGSARLAVSSNEQATFEVRLPILEASGETPEGR